MNTANVRILNRKMSAEELIGLRSAAGWVSPAPEHVRTALENTIYCLCAMDGEKVVGCGRIAGDGGMNFYVQDVIVLPEYRGKRIGSGILDGLSAWLKKHLPVNAAVWIFAAKGVDKLYEKYGFICRPNDAMGPGMYYRNTK